MLWMLLTTLAAFGGRWDDHPTDIVVDRTIEASAEELSLAVAQFGHLAGLFPEKCVEDWAIASPSVARMTYRMGPMKRRLTGRIARFERGRMLEIDHEGNKGFITRFLFEPRGEATRVQLVTYIHPPPRPFRGVYFKRVKPAWVQCYAEALDELADRIEQRERWPK